MTFFSKNPTFDKLIDKATSHLLLEPDWAANLTACDMIRQGEVTGKYAIGIVKKKLNNSNPHVVIYALNLIESMAKNCGSSIHDEIATQDFMNQIKTLVKEKDPVRSKSLELIQVWSHAFRHQSKYNIVQTTYNLLKSQGSNFPSLVESDAMFVSETAPEWQDADYCYRCKIAFSALKRKVPFMNKITGNINIKHHCRNCGNIFCDECTSKRSNIPKFGIEKDVRVCESCYDLIKGSDVRTGRISSKKGGHVQFNEDVVVRNFTPEAKEGQSEITRAQKERDLDLQEKEELELALALSASEAESQEMKKTKPVTKSAIQPTPNNQTGFNGIYSTLDTSEMDPELARYLNRNYWEKKANNVSNIIKTTQPSAPVMPVSSARVIQSNNEQLSPSINNISMNKNGNDFVKLSEISSEQEEFLSALKSSIEIFVNRMHSNRQRGRSIANDSAVQTLFLTLNAMHPQLLQYINEQDDQRSYFEALQDKLAQLRDAREALDALREEHREKKRREEEEAAKLRQIQMMQKLEIMRQKKQEFLDYQRQLAVDRMQQQEREMAVRLAQQKQLMQMRQYQQQFPFSMQQQQQSMNTIESSNINQQLYHNLPQYGVTPSTVPGMNIESYGYPIPNQFAIPSTEFYNLQGLSQNLPPGRLQEGQLNPINYNPNMMPQTTQSMYALPTQHIPNWEIQNENNPSTTNSGTNSKTASDQKENQLISFD